MVLQGIYAAARTVAVAPGQQLPQQLSMHSATPPPNFLLLILDSIFAAFPSRPAELITYRFCHSACVPVAST